MGGLRRIWAFLLLSLALLSLAASSVVFPLFLLVRSNPLPRSPATQEDA